MLFVFDKHRGRELLRDRALIHGVVSSILPKFRILSLFFSFFFSLSLLNYRNGECWIVVYIMFVTKSVGIANIIITPEKHFTRKKWT